MRVCRASALCLIALALVMCPRTEVGLAQGNPPTVPQQRIYSEIIPMSSGLPLNPANDTRETVVAPNGGTVKVLL